MKQLYIDFDGVILDTMTKSYEELKKENIDRKDEEKVREFFKNADWKKTGIFAAGVAFGTAGI